MVMDAAVNSKQVKQFYWVCLKKPSLDETEIITFSLSYWTNGIASILQREKTSCDSHNFPSSPVNTKTLSAILYWTAKYFGHFRQVMRCHHVLGGCIGGGHISGKWHIRGGDMSVGGDTSVLLTGYPLGVISLVGVTCLGELWHISEGWRVHRGDTSVSADNSEKGCQDISGGGEK